MIRGLLDQSDLGEPVFMPIVNLYYKSDLSSDSSFCTASNGGLVAGSQLKTHTRTHTHCTQIAASQGQSKGQCLLRYI